MRKKFLGRRWFSLSLAMGLFLSQGSGESKAQTVYTWQNATSNWDTNTNWGPTGVPGGSLTDVGQFRFSAGSQVNATLNTSATFTTLNFASSNENNYLINGTGLFFVGTSTNATTNGVATRSGIGTYTINLGNGTDPSLTVTGPSAGAGGSFNIGSSSRLVLTGATVAVTTGTAVTSIRSGTLVLDNTTGNPSSQRMSTTSAVNLNGGGSTLELRGSSSGTSFTGFTGALGSSGSGDTYLRMVQSGSAALSVNFASLSRLNTSGNLIVENIGTGFVGDVGKPQVTFTTAPTTRQGLISTSTSTTIPYVFVSSRSAAGSNDVTARWAGYSTSISASTTAPFTGDFGGATAGTNVLFNPTTAGTVTQGATANQLASVVLEPGTSGVTYDLGVTGQLNTLGVLVSGNNDMTVTGGSLFATSTAGTRVVAVVNPTTALITNSNLAAQSSPLTVTGEGFVILNGTTNQIAYGTTQNINLGGGTLRVTAQNFNPTTATVRFRGGVLEYDVSAAANTFNLALGVAANTVNWTANAGFSAATNVGGGGFSAWSGAGNGNGNALTVNIGGAAATLYWNDAASTGAQLFVTDGYALKFGSLRSNSTVIFQNPIALDGSSGAEGVISNTQAYQRTREIQVIRGVGNAADKTQLVGTISGTATVDLAKTGTGVLELTGANTYAGSTFVQAGTLLVNNTTGSATGVGNVSVRPGAILGGTGIIAPTGGNSVLVRGGISPGNSIGTLRITGPVTIGATGNLTTETTSTPTTDLLQITGSLTLQPGASLILPAGNTYAPLTTYTIASFTSLTGTFASVVNLPLGATLSYTPTEIQLVTPIPEPATFLGFAGLVGLAIRLPLRARKKQA